MRKNYVCAGLLMAMALTTACGKKYEMKEVPTAALDTLPADILVETGSTESQGAEETTTGEQVSSVEAGTESSESGEGIVDDAKIGEPGSLEGMNDQYQVIVDKYRTMIQEQWDYGKIYNEELSTMIPMFYDQNAASMVGFTLYDINGDGTQELLIGETDTDEPVNRLIFDAYTMKNGKAEQIFTSHERNLYYLINDEAGVMLIGNEGSNGAANSGWFYYYLDHDGRLVIVQGILYDAMDSPDQPWFETNDEDWDISNDTPIDEETAQNLIDSYAENYAKFDWTTFAE